MSVEPTRTHAAPDEPPTRTQPAVEAGSTRTHPAADPARTGTFSSHSGAETPIPSIPGYDILDVLGEGGMGRVYRARQHATDRTVALKVLLAGELASSSARDRFRAEVTATAKLSHSHIVQVFEAGEADGRAFLVCEFVPGGSLAARLDGAPWDATPAARLIGPLSRAVAAAHQVGIVHRDLKPSNILQTLDGTPKLADFGIAKRLDSDSRTQTGAVLGTPSYMAPEQAGGSKEIGPAADVYGLGAILYELLTGRPPFRGKDFVETIDLVRTQEPVPPRVFQPKLPRDIETICLKCLQKDPAKRYASAEALADDLDRFLEHRPIQARPVGSIERAWRWCRRNRAVAALLAAVLIVSVTGAVIATIYANEASEFARIAGKNAGDAERREKEANDERAKADGLLKQTEEHLYAAQISQAYVAAQELRTERLLQILEAAKPQSGRPDRRGWEWHYLNRLARSWESERQLDPTSSALASFDSRTESLWCPLSLDGKRAIARSSRQANVSSITRAGLFETATGRMIRDLPELKAPSRGPSGPVFDPEMRYAAWLEDYQKANSADAKPSTRWRVKLMNLDTGAIETPFPELGGVPSLRVATGGNRIVASFFSDRPFAADPQSPPRWLEVWERGRTGTLRAAFPSDAHGAQANALLGVSPDTMTAVFSFPKPKKGTGAAAYDAPHFSVCSLPSNAAGASMKLSPRGSDHYSPVTHSFQFSAGGRMFTHADGASGVAVFDAQTGAKLWRYETGSDSLGFWLVSDDGRRLVRRGRNESLIVAERIGEPNIAVEWRTSVLRAPLQRSDGLLDHTLRLSGDGRRVSVSSSSKIWEWDLTRIDFERSWPERLRLDGKVRFAMPGPRGRWILHADTRGVSGLAGIYDTERHEIVRRFDTKLEVSGGSVSADGRRALFTMIVPPTAEFDWSLWATDETPRELARGLGMAEMSDDGRWLVERAIDAVRIYRTADGKLVRELPVPKGTGAGIPRRWITPDGAFALLTYLLPALSVGKPPESVTMTLRFHDIETGTVRGEWIMPAPWPVLLRRRSGQDTPIVFAPEPCYSPDGKKLGLANVAEDGSVRAWVLDTATGMQLAEYTAPATANSRLPVTNGLNPLSGQHRVGAFGAGEQFAVWSGKDLVMWAGPQSAPMRLSGHEDGNGVAFSSDGKRVFTLDGILFGSREQTLRAWDADAGRELLTVRIVGEDHSGAYGSMLDEMWLEGDRLYVGAMNGVRVFDGTPLK